MSMFEKASRIKLRIPTERGSASVEDLWDMSLAALNNVAKGLRKKLKEVEEEDFLAVTKPSETLEKLSFDIVLHILNVKKTEKEKREEAVLIKQKRDKIASLIETKEEEELLALSKEDLHKLYSSL